MPSDRIADLSTTDVGNIDQKRIVDGHRVHKGLFCSLCQCLLWKPRSCSVCHHNFCEKCIQTWLDQVVHKNKCPSGCMRFKNGRSPRDVQSLLSRVNIHCRNESLGCAEIVSYDQLEQHENVQCQYRTKQCPECEQLILFSKYVEHQETQGMCRSCQLKCIICRKYFKETVFRRHFHQCSNARTKILVELMYRSSDNQIEGFDQADIHSGISDFLKYTIPSGLVYKQQKQMFGLPTRLKGVDVVQQARDQNCGYLYHTLLMFKFLLLNWRKIPFFIFILSYSSLLSIVFRVFNIHISLRRCSSIYRSYGFLFLVVFSFLSTFTISIIGQYLSDRTMIVFFGLSMFVFNCVTNRSLLEVFEDHPFFNSNKRCVGIYCLSMLAIKIILFLIRRYSWLVPTWIIAMFFIFLPSISQLGETHHT